MERPAVYNQYANSNPHIPMSLWPAECREYYRLARWVRKHPEYKNLSNEEVKRIRNETIAAARVQHAQQMRDATAQKSPEERAEINRKKGSFYHKLTPEEKLQQNEILRQRSQAFWDGMTKEQREEFSRYRWDLRTDEEKRRIAERLILAGKQYMGSIPKEEIDAWIEKLNDARAAKREQDPAYRAVQDALLRQHNRSYMESLTPAQKSAILHDNRFNKRFEHQFADSILSNQFVLEKEFVFSLNPQQFKVWDYAIHDQETGVVDMVVDLDGSYYHADEVDYDGLHSKEERDEKRGLFVPPGVKVFIITEKNFINSFQEMMKLLMIDYEGYIQRIFQHCRQIPFPYPDFDTSRLIKSYKQLLRLDPNGKHVSLQIRNREGDALIQHFHHSIWHARTNGKISPYEAWQDYELLMKCIRNRTLYQSSLNLNKILQGFNISKIAPKVSVFSAGRAKLLIDRYLSQYQVIRDPFSGFSGRMLGAISLRKFYIGSDISSVHVQESRRIIDFLSKIGLTLSENFVHPEMFQADATAITGEFQCLFTCPPYGLKEQWLGVTPSTRSCDEWITICLENFHCERYLFVVDETTRYANHIVDVIENKSHFGSNREYIILI